MSIPITPVDFETNIPGMVISAVSAEVSDLAPNPLNELVVDRNVEIEAYLHWDQVGTNPWTDFFLGLANAQWHAKATLMSVDGGASASQVATQAYVGGAGPKTMKITFPANTLNEGTYQLFLSCHLKAGGGQHLATSFVAQGRAVEVFDALLVP
jgi:hypothetical protein